MKRPSRQHYLLYSHGLKLGQHAGVLFSASVGAFFLLTFLLLMSFYLLDTFLTAVLNINLLHDLSPESVQFSGAFFNFFRVKLIHLTDFTMLIHPALSFGLALSLWVGSILLGFQAVIKGMLWVEDHYLSRLAFYAAWLKEQAHSAQTNALMEKELLSQHLGKKASNSTSKHTRSLRL